MFGLSTAGQRGSCERLRLGFCEQTGPASSRNRVLEFEIYFAPFSTISRVSAFVPGPNAQATGFSSHVAQDSPRVRGRGVTEGPQRLRFEQAPPGRGHAVAAAREY